MTQIASQPRSLRTPLTPRQLDVYTLICEGRERTGFSPTLQAMADAMGVSKVTVYQHVNELVRKRVLVRDPHKSRSLRPAQDDFIRSLRGIADQLQLIERDKMLSPAGYRVEIYKVRCHLLALLPGGAP